MSSTSTSTTPSPIPQPPVQASGFVHNEQGILIPFYKNEVLDQYMGTNSDSMQNTWSEHTNYSTPPWLPQQVIMSQPPHHVSAQAMPIEWDVSRTHGFTQNHHSLHQAPPPHMSAPVSYVPPVYEHHISPASVPPTMPTSAHSRPRTSNPRHSRPHLPRQHSSHSNDQHGTGAAHGPTLQQLVDNNRKNDHRQSHQGHISQHGRHRHGNSNNHHNSRMGAPYQSYPAPFEGIPPTSVAIGHHPYHTPKGMSTTHMAGPAQWNALPPAYENA
ncbi:hypothetical protein BS47DRAFT_1068902 [Hydnum rufescens UP504]|uniref:Uncharacterized protein n=1 Tax=Hydnum rufescens UP504 TaxID=1448309 RepID=A0A9P6AX31_9AGAM|nr:hypothetical protein BS47DRAFT_1068902 [Hydnum rufescens UP504]